MKAYDLPIPELMDSPLASLAKEAGYASLVSMLNERRMWSWEVERIEALLRKEVAAMEAQSAE